MLKSSAIKSPFWQFVRQPFQSNKRRPVTYKDYAAALSECIGLGYDCSDIARSVVSKTKLYSTEISQPSQELRLDLTSSFSLAAMSLAAAGGTVLKVLDFGGAAGLHYFLTRKLISPSIQIQWVVVETPTMVEVASPALANQELRFVTDLADASKLLNGIDIVHSSGAIQYVADPSELVLKFASLNANYLLLNRIGVTLNDQHLIATHQSRLQDHGPGKGAHGVVDRLVRTPFVFVSETRLMNSVTGNYRVVARIDDPSGVFSVRNEPIRGLGILARRA